MNLAHFLPLLVFALATNISPGPNNLMLMQAGLNFGIKRSLPHYLAICFGFPLLVFCVALGLGAVFQQSLWLQQGLKIVGAVYLAYLALRLLFAATRPSAATKPLSFVQAMLFQWVNPKAWIMAVGLVALFHDELTFLYQACLLAGLYALTCLLCTGSWLLFGSYLNRIIHKPVLRLGLNTVLALSLLWAIWMLF